MRISEVLRNKDYSVVAVPSNATIMQAVDLMQTRGVGAVVVIDAGKLRGIVAERDIVMALAELRTFPKNLTVAEIMNADVQVAAAGDSVQQTMQVMTKHRARHIPVVNNGQVVGVVSLGDIIKSRLAEKTEENQVLLDLARLRHIA
jgi:CBS domain-containing protein